MTRGHEPFALMRDARVRLDVVLGLAAVSNRAYSVALVVYVYGATHSSLWVAAATGARYLPGIVTSELAAPLVDRIAPRAILIAANVGCGITLAVMAVSVGNGAPPGVAIALAAVVRIFASGQPPAAARLLPVVAGGRDLAQVAARQGVIDKIMVLAGPAFGGLLLLTIHPETELAILAGFCACAAAAARLLPEPQVPMSLGGAPRATAALGRRATRVGTVDSTANLAVFVAISGLAGFVYGTDTVVLNVVANAHLHLHAAGYGELFAGLGAGGLLMAPVVNRLVRQHRLAGLVAIGMSVYCLPSVLVAQVHQPVAVVVLEAVRGAGALVVDVVALTEMQRIVLPQGLPALTSRLISVVFGAVAAGALISPAILHALGTDTTLTVLGVAPSLLVFAAYPTIRRSDSAIAGRLTELGPRVDVLQRLGLLHATSWPVLERLARDVTEVDVVAGETIVAEGDVADAFYVVLSGDLDVFNGQQRVNALTAGDWFGEIGLLEGRARTATVVARDQVALYRIGGAAFLEALAQLPPSPTLLDSVAARLENTRVLADGTLVG